MRVLTSAVLFWSALSAQSGPEILGWQLSPDAVCGSQTRAAACRLPSVPSGESAWRTALNSAAKSGARVVVVPATTVNGLAAADRAATDENVTVAVVAGNQPETSLKAISAYSRHIGLWAEPAAWDKAGTRPLAAIFMLRDRLAGGTLTPGSVSEEFVKEAYRLDLKPLVWVMPAEDAKLKNTIDALVSYHASYASRTQGVRRLGEITPEEQAKLESAIPATAPAKPQKPRRLLVFDLNVGRFGHPSIPYANLAMQLMGKKTGAWEATVSSDPAILDPASLRQFDAVYLNNTIGDIFSTAAVRDAFASYVAAGGGLIGNHATTVTATDWKEFGNILGGRGASHRMTDEKVTISVEDPANPITQVFGKGPFVYADEIFRFQPPYSRENVRVLLSVDPLKTNMNQGRCYGQCYREDNDYPVAWVKPYGKGRVFYTTLGHNAYVFQDSKMLSFFLAGIQYALGDLKVDDTPQPRPAVDIDGVLRELSKWDRGQDQRPVRRLERALGMPGKFEPVLIAFLGTNASAAAKGEVCRHLAEIGTSAAVPAMAKLLDRAETAEMARYALERIPSPQALTALREALPSAPNVKLQTAIMYSLGRKKDEGSVGTLSNLLDSSDASIATAAANALGLIGTPAAEQALRSVALSRVSADALLNLADHADSGRAVPIYRKLADEKAPSEIRTAAIRALARRSDADTVTLLKTACLDKSADLSAAAIAELARLDAPALVGIVSQLNASGKIEALSQLASYHNQDALSLLRDALRVDVPELRIAALNGLSEIGTDADVPSLVDAATRAGSEAEKAAARVALARIPAEGADAALVAALSAAKTPAARSEVIRAIGERGTVQATDALVAAAAEQDVKIRRESLRALQNVAMADYTPTLLSLLTKAGDDERPDAEHALSAAIHRAEKPNLKPVIEAFRSAGNPDIKASLIAVLASTGSDEALPAVREALRSSDPALQRAAITGLSGWRSPEPAEDLLQIARTSQSQALQVLGLRGYVKLVQLPVGRAPSETAKLLNAAMQAATRADEKKIVLAAVQRVPAPESLEIARAALNDPAIAAEAKAATAVLERSLAAQRRSE